MGTPTARVLRLPYGAALSGLVEATLGPTALIVLVEAAFGLIHSAVLVETALGPIHGTVLSRLPSPTLPVKAAFGRILGNTIINQVGAASDVPVKALLVNVAQCLTSRSDAALALTAKAALGRLLLARRLASWPPTSIGVRARPQ